MDSVLNIPAKGGEFRDGGRFAGFVADESLTFREVAFDDRKVTGGQLAMAMNRHPVEEFVVLRHLASGELEELRPTETADLADTAANHFFVIKGAELYRFEVAGLSMVWPRAKLLAGKIKYLARASEEDELVLERDGVDRNFDDEDEVDVGGPGFERFRLRRRKATVTVFYGGDHQPFELERRPYTTEELITTFGVPHGYRLDAVLPDGTFHEMAPGEKLKPKDGMEFASHPPIGQSA